MLVYEKKISQYVYCVELKVHSKMISSIVTFVQQSVLVDFAFQKVLLNAIEHHN